nr:Dihydrofolate reductase [uncultured bacterium]
MRVFIIAAVTADGFIARHTDHLSDWTSVEDKKLFVALTKEAGVMVMGSRTFATIGRALPGRRTIVYTTHPERITAAGVETSNEDPKVLIKRLEQEGATGLAVCGGGEIYSLFMSAGVIAELYLTIEPILFGQGIPLFKKELDSTLLLNEVRALNNHTMLLHYKVA